MPDALSKTVPIWCCVMNRAIFPDSGPHDLHTPHQAVSSSEHAQIEQRIDGFVKEFLEICAPDIVEFKLKVQKPLRPLWVIQSSSLPEMPPAFTDFHPIVLCTASRRVHGNEGSENGYIQGAADDQEAWSYGLTPKLFWSNKEQLLSTNEDELPDLIADLVKHEKGPDARPVLVRPTTKLFVSSSHNVNLQSFSTIISCTPSILTTTKPEDLQKKYLHLSCGTGKLGSRDLRTHLALLSSFFSSLPDEIGNILICCPTGKDLSVGVALTILCLYTDDKGIISRERTGKKVDKKFIKQRLTWLTTTSPTLNPSRGTLQSVNAFLMPDPYSTAKDTRTPVPVLKSQLTLVDAEGQPISKEPTSALTSTAQSSNFMSLPSTLFTNILATTAKPWSFTRTLTSALPTHPSGTVTGTATLTPFSTSTPSMAATALLYAEEGEFATTTGLKFTTRRKYVYQLKNDAVIVFFHEEEKEGGVGGLFVEMGDLSLEESDGEGEKVWVAKNRETHLCGEDLYSASWRFGGGMFGGEGEKWWEVRYDVVGPKKEYVSETRYTIA